MAGLWGAVPSPLPTSPRLLDQMGQLHQGGLRDDRRQAGRDPSLTTAPCFRAVPGTPSWAGSWLLGLTTQTGGRGTGTTPSALFISAPDTDRQTDGRTCTDKGTDRPSRKDSHRVKSDRRVRVGTQARTRAHTHRVRVRGESACMGGLGSEPGQALCSQAKPPPQPTGSLPPSPRVSAP